MIAVSTWAAQAWPTVRVVGGGGVLVWLGYSLGRSTPPPAPPRLYRALPLRVEHRVEADAVPDGVVDGRERGWT